MTKDVLITVSGRQFDVTDEPVVLVTRGNYYQKNGKHYVLYEEQQEGIDGVIKNRIKFYGDHYEMVKSGAVVSALKFSANEKHESVYNTTAGAVMMSVDTNEVRILESDERIDVLVNYSLDINGQFISKCSVEITIDAVRINE